MLLMLYDVENVMLIIVCYRMYLKYATTGGRNEKNISSLKNKV